MNKFTDYLILQTETGTSIDAIVTELSKAVVTNPARKQDVVEHYLGGSFPDH